jgi:hypothetical protein
MKRILLLLLLTVSVYGQNPSRFAKIQITGNSNSGTATKVNVQETNGEVNTQAINSGFNKNIGLTSGDIVGANTLLNQYTTAPVDWSATAFNSGQVVFYAGKQWIATSNTVAGDIPATSSKWVDVTFEGLYNKPVSGGVWGGITGTLSAQTDLQTALDGKENLSSKGISNGYAGLDASGKVPLTQINDALIGSVNYQGTYNAATNTPALPTISTSNKGFYFVVSAAGTQAGLALNPGDWIISNGTAWGKIDNNNAVTAVNGFAGNVTLSTSNIAEGSNLYYTDARVNANASVDASAASRHNALTLGTANGLSLSTQALSLGLASTSTTGALSSTDWNVFNNKPSSTGVGASGTWGINITGVAANATNWGGRNADLNAVDNDVVNLLQRSHDGITRLTDAIGVRTWLGLGSNAYTSTDYFKYENFQTNANTMSENRSGFTYQLNAPYNGPIAYFGAIGYGLQLNAAYNQNGNEMAFRSRNGETNSFNPWRKLWHDGNFNPNNYLPLTGGTLSGSLTAPAFFQSSDRRLKTILKRDGDVAYFKWKDKRDTKTHIGYIAQEVRKNYPHQVQKNEKGLLSVNYIEVLVAKVQNLEKRIQELEQKK